MRKRITYFIVAFLALGLIVTLQVCCTQPKRNPAYEEEIEAFVRQAVPGSEMELFNGEDLSGWYVRGLGKWSVEDGVLTVRRGIGYLGTRCDKFDDFILTLEARCNQEGNSGVYFRSTPPEGLYPWPQGYEAQIDNHDPENYTGSLYDRVLADELLTEDNEWFEMKITAIDDQIEIAIDGETVVHTTDDAYRKGFIALQAHDPFSRVDFKNIRIQLPDEDHPFFSSSEESASSD